MYARERGWQDSIAYSREVIATSAKRRFQEGVTPLSKNGNPNWSTNNIRN